MANRIDEVVKYLERILMRSRRKDPEISIRPNWQADLMRDIRLIGPLGVKARGLERFGSLAWRFSLVGAACMLVLALYTLKTGFFPYQDVANAVLDDPVGVIYSSFM